MQFIAPQGVYTSVNKSIYTHFGAINCTLPANDPYMQTYVKDNKDGFLNNNLKKDSINFKTGNMYYAHHLVDVIDYRFDSYGNLELVIFDTNDYNENDPSNLVQAGDIAMKRGDLIPKYVIKHALIPKEKLDELWNDNDK